MGVVESRSSLSNASTLHIRRSVQRQIPRFPCRDTGRGFFCGRLQPPGRTGAGGWRLPWAQATLYHQPVGKDRICLRATNHGASLVRPGGCALHNLASNLIIILIIAVDFSCGLLYNVARFRNTSRERGFAMYCVRKVTEDLTWVGGNDRRLALFEGVYDVPKGVSYNSYLLMDEKTVLFDTVDHSVDRVFFENIDHVLAGGQQPHGCPLSKAEGAGSKFHFGTAPPLGLEATV